MSFAEYLDDLIIRSAVERFLINIGISAAKLREDYPDEFDDFDALRLAIGVRNRLAYGYDDLIDDAQIWEITQTSFPRLISEIDQRT